MSKITLATIKSFIKKNRAELHIKVTSSFNGMSDMVEQCDDNGFHPIVEDGVNAQGDYWKKATLGIQGVWFVGQSRDYFSVFNDGVYAGYRVHNACGSFIVAVRIC